jgi:hypothetical protein
MSRFILSTFVAALTVVAACSDGGGPCQSDSDCKGDRICREGACVDPGTTGGSDAGKSDAGTIKCGENGLYCRDNVLRKCATDAVIVDCDTCKYIGPGTGSKYDTSCKDEAADCTTCNAQRPWTGPGCYFGGGPAECP